MKKRILALTLIFVTVMNTLLVSCGIPEESGEPDKYGDFELSYDKVQNAFFAAIDKINYALPTFTDKFPDHASVNNVYPAVDNNAGWNTGFWTGILWHAYELTGNATYSETATAQVATFYNRIDKRLGVDFHDMGFLYTPSCVAAYKITGNELAREAALLAADNLISRYHEKGEFIQAWGAIGNASEYRLIVDCLMNIPLLFWASEVTGDTKYRDVAYSHFTTTLEVCYRENGSTYHTYFFDTETGEPTVGATHQGVSDDSTWSRGQSWAMYGPLLTYKYEENPEALLAFKAAADYYLEHLPDDYVPYWDLAFQTGSTEPRDSSSAAIAVCALFEGAKQLDEDDPARTKYLNAAKRIMNSLIDSYTTEYDYFANGLLIHGTYNKPTGNGIDEMTIWGDYFYMEALHRFLDPEWELYW